MPFRSKTALMIWTGHCMIATIDKNGRTWKADLSKGLDISITVSASGPRAWYVDAASIKPVVNEHYTGSVQLGGKVNFRDVYFNPHGHGTHTECVGHISHEDYDVNQLLKSYFFIAELISVSPITVEVDGEIQRRGDRMIVREQIEKLLNGKVPEALVIRTLPNDRNKMTRNYSGTNFCYFEKQALEWMAQVGIQHLLVDLPSVDRESDGGALEGHHAFWKYPGDTRLGSTITEFVFADNVIPDGAYLLNLQLAPFTNDASPSRPVLFKLSSE